MLSLSVLIWLPIVQEVQYKKWLTNYKLGVHDKKVRPNGAPKVDSALKGLGMHLLDAQGGSMDDLAVDPFLLHDRFKLQAPTKQHVSVVVQTQDGIDTREFPIDFPAARLSADLGVDALPGYAVTVNGRIPAPSTVLKCGDLVQVVTLEAALSRSPPDRSSGSSSQRQQTLVFFPGSSTPVAVPAPSTSAPSAAAPRAAGLPPVAPAPGSVRRVRVPSGGRTAMH